MEDVVDIEEEEVVDNMEDKRETREDLHYKSTIDLSEVSDQTIIIETEILSSGRLRCCRTPLSLQTPRKQKPESSEDARDVLVKPC